MAVARAVLLLLASTAQAWMPDANARIHVKYGDDTPEQFVGNITGPNHFRILEKDDFSILVGGRSMVYNLSLYDLSENIEQVSMPSHKQFQIAKKQMTGHSGVFSFRHTGGLKESRKFLSSLEIFILAESLGGYESLAELPSVMTHASVPEEQRLELGITDSLIRLSVGLEDTEDLIADLDQAFNIAFK